MIKDLIAISWEFSGGFSKDIAEKVVLSAESFGVCVRTIPGKRDTWRVTLPEGIFYVRHVFNEGFLRPFLFGVSERFFGDEIAISKALLEKGVNVSEVLAYGQVRGAPLGVDAGALGVRHAVTITAEVAGAKTLKDFYFSEFAKFSRKEKKEAINEFAGFLRRLHDKGVTHEDPHMGNILVRRNGGYEFFLLDVRDCRFRKKPSLAERFLNLVLLNLNFISGIENSLKFSFFRRYCEGLALAEKGGVKNAIDGIEDMTLRVAFETWDKKAARCMNANNLFIASRRGTHSESGSGLAVHVKRPWEAKEGMERVISSPDVFLEGKDRAILKNGRTVKAGLVMLPSGEKLFLKRYNRKDFFHTLKNVFKASRARDVWRKSYAAELRGLNVPRPVAYMEERSFGVLKRSYVVSEFIDGARLGSVIEAGRYSEEFFRCLGRTIGDMHRLGFFHGDLKWSNILVKEGIRPVFYFTDIDGSRVEKRLALSHVERDIKRFSREMKKYGIPEASKRAFFEGYGARNRFIDIFELCRYGD